MASPRGNSGQSAPMLSQDLQPSTAVGFQQQGTVDWTRVMSGSVTFSVDVLSRLSNAGIEAFTIYAARAIFSNVKLGPNGELRLHRALDKLSSFPSFGKVLWFGFGVKNIIWSMKESTEGLNCLGICACLTEGYSTNDAAKVIRELFLLYNPPAELTPAMRQWVALVESSQGLLASSEFGLVLHGLTKHCLQDGQPNIRRSGSPEDIALVLKEVFEVSAGRLDRLFLSGGADCAWIASLAHWLLDLRVEVRDQDGTIVYRPDGTRSVSSADAQIIITYYKGRSSEILRVSRKHYVIPSGRVLFGSFMDHDMMPCGRVPWETCLVDTFGSPMRLLLGSQARSTGACLGSAARILLAHMRDGEGHMGPSKKHHWRPDWSPISESSYGRGFYLLARRLLPELGQNPVLLLAMEEAMKKEYSDAAQQLSQSFASLKQLCSCLKCRRNFDIAIDDPNFCLLALTQTICTLVRAMSTICVQQGFELQPTRSGLEGLYWAQRMSHGDQDCSRLGDGLLGPWPMHTLSLAQMLFAGDYNSSGGIGHVVAESRSGLCFCLNTLTEITSDPQRACIVTIIPGKIQWNNSVYDVVRDLESDPAIASSETRYHARSMTTITTYDELVDSSTPGLNAELIIEESMSPQFTSLSAMYRVSIAAFPGRHVSFGPAYIWRCLNWAFTAVSCEGKTCDSLNGFQSILVEGEGFLPPTPDWESTCLPITRVLSTNDISVWVALSQPSLPITSDGFLEKKAYFSHRLQGKQCVRCCIVNAENGRMRSERNERCPTSIITSV